MNSGELNRGGCWPTTSQRLLLRAALLPGAAAVDALKAWRAGVDLRKLDSGSQRLLPLLFKNLLAEDIDDPLLKECKDAYKNCFCGNEVRLHTTAEVLTAFHQAGITTMLLKGSALIPLYYRDSGLRPMADSDVLVHFEHADRATAVLRELGFNPYYENPQRQMLVVHSTPFDDPTGRQLDLHWHVMWECWHADDDEGYWKRSVPVEIHNVRTRALDPTDQLLHVCWHGARWDETPPIRWIADAVTILRTASEQIDWARLVDQARGRHLSLQLYDCLNYLRSELDMPIPAETLKALIDIPVFINERLGYRIATNPLKSRTSIEILRGLGYELTWFLSSTRFRDWPIATATLVQNKWKIDRRRQIPFVLSARALRRLGKKFEP